MTADQISSIPAPPEELYQFCQYCGAECYPANPYAMCDTCRAEESKEWLLEHNGW